jgi:hypothetical protein
MLHSLGRHWFHASADEVAARVPDPEDVYEMFEFLELERELEKEQENGGPRPLSLEERLEAEARVAAFGEARS